MNAHQAPLKPRRLTSESTVFRRGPIGDRVNGNTAEGRFLAKVERELIAEIGGNPTFSQMLLIKRCSMAMLRLHLLDEKMASGSWTDHDGRVFGGLNNSVRLLLREINALAVKGKAKARALDLGDIVSRHKASAP
jgi:hypothetical protein